MIGSILQMLAFDVAEDNIEQFAKVFASGGNFKLDTGMTGDGVAKLANKFLGTKLDNSFGVKFTVNAAKRSMGGKALGIMVGALGKFFFDPRLIALRIAAKMSFDYAKGKQQEDIANNIMSMPTEDNSYKLDERFNMVHQSNAGQMEYIGQSINAVLSQGNLAGDLLDRAIGKM